MRQISGGRGWQLRRGYGIIASKLAGYGIWGRRAGVRRREAGA